MLLTEGRSGPFPNVEPNALAVMDAVQNLVDVGRMIVAGTADEVGKGALQRVAMVLFSSQGLQVDLPVAYNQALLAGNQLVESARALLEEPSFGEAQSSLNSAAKGILEGTMKVFLYTVKTRSGLFFVLWVYVGVAGVGRGRGEEDHIYCPLDSGSPGAGQSRQVHA